MAKPITFNYKHYEELCERYAELEVENTELKAKIANLEIENRILKGEKNG